jgi:hypothetical protein
MQKSASASTGTQIKSTSSVQGTLNNSKDNGNDGSNNPVAKLAASRSMLSEDTRHKLEDIVAQLEEKSVNSGDSKFLRILDGEERVILFDPDKVEHLVITYPAKEGEPESKPTKRIKFLVKEANADGVIPEGTEEIEWTASETAGADALRWILKGFLLLDVARKGSGKRDTKYTISPHL